MIARFKAWRAAAKAKAKQRAWHAGYDYATDALLCKEDRDMLEAQASGWNGPDDFDRGMIAAMIAWDKLHDRTR